MQSHGDRASQCCVRVEPLSCEASNMCTEYGEVVWPEQVDYQSMHVLSVSQGPTGSRELSVFSVNTPCGFSAGLLWVHSSSHLVGLPCETTTDQMFLSGVGGGRFLVSPSQARTGLTSELVGAGHKHSIFTHHLPWS